MMNNRIGFGYDVHKLGEGEKLILGGIEIPHNKGCIAHSDGDVLIHAICDALLGAANLRDIGFHFPDNDSKYKNMDSKIILSKTMDLLQNNHYQIINIDTTVCLQEPKLSPFIPDMKKALASTMQIPMNNVSIKATTTEKMGFVGQKEGITAYAVVLLYQTNN